MSGARRFFVPKAEEETLLEGEEFEHAKNVLRLSAGDEAVLLDNSGKEFSAIVAEVRKNTDIPCAVGFGISTPVQAKKMSASADGVIVGSAIIKLLEKYGKDAPAYIRDFVASMKSALI